MPVLDRSALEASPLADLHAVASEISIDGYRRLRRADLISAILDKQGGGDGTSSATRTPERPTERPPRQRRARSTTAKAKPEPEAGADKPEAAKAQTSPGGEDSDADTAAGSPRRRGRRGGRARASGRADEASAESSTGDGDGNRDAAGRAEEPVVEGVVELLAGGSGFVRVDPPEPSDNDVYISSAQIKRCELVSGDRVTGPKRAPRRSERFASLIRIETINGRPASELSDSVRFDDLPAAFPSDAIELGADDPTLKALTELTPFGKGSRVSIVGPPRSGKTEALRRIAQALADRDDLTVSVVLAGARPEEIAEWSQGPIAPAASSGLTASPDHQDGTVEPVVDQARRLAARGSDAVVLIDSLDACSPLVARRALGSARNIVDGGSVTVIATGSAPVGGETTVVTLDLAKTAIGRFPAVDVLASGVLRPELLVGETKAKAIIRARKQAAKAD
jgi:transcription termination factor Rho